jgi:HEAT repeat protein
MEQSGFEKIKLQTVIDSLLDDDAEFPVEYFPSFSDLEDKELKQLISIWNQITPERKAKLFENLEIINESDTLMDFNQIARIALADPSAVVRASGLRILKDYEDEKLIPILIDLLLNDIDSGVRTQAASSLGMYIYLGEIEEIHPNSLKKAEDCLIQVLKSSEIEIVRLKALESIGYSSRDEVPPLIINAFQSGDYEWIAAALAAMGKSADETWGTQVLSMLAHPDNRIQKEAIIAAGELELRQARKLLLKMVLEAESDEEIWHVCIWSLAKIGGNQVKEVFDRLLENASTEEDEIFLQEALDNLYLTTNIAPDFNILTLQEPDGEKFREIDIDDEELDLDIGGKSWLDELEDKLEELLDDDLDDEDYLEEGEEKEE